MMRTTCFMIAIIVEDLSVCSSYPIVHFSRFIFLLARVLKNRHPTLHHFESRTFSPSLHFIFPKHRRDQRPITSKAATATSAGIHFLTIVYDEVVFSRSSCLSRSSISDFERLSDTSGISPRRFSILLSFQFLSVIKFPPFCRKSIQFLL